MSNFVEGYLSTVLFLFNPIVGFIVSLKGIVRNSYCSVLIAISLLTLMAYVMKPYVGWDIVRYYEYYNSNSTQTVNWLSLFFDIGTVSVFINFLSAHGIKKELIPALSTFLQYFGIFTALHKTISQDEKKKKNLYYYIILFLSSSFIASASGVRNGASLGIFVLGFYYWTNNKNIKAYTLFLISSAIHFFIILPILLILVSKLTSFIKDNFYRNILYILIPISLLGVGNLIISSIFIVLKPLLSAINLYKVDYVISGEYSTISFNNIYDIILRVLVLLPIIYMSWRMLAINKENSDYLKEKNIIYQLLIICFLFSSMGTLFNRYSVLTEILCVIYFCKMEGNVRFFYKGLKYKDYILLIFLLLSCIKPLGQYRGVYIPSWGQLFTKSTYQLINQSVMPKDYIPGETQSIRAI